jgi:hypothetical protein
MGASALTARWTQEAPGGPTSVNPRGGATGINQALGPRQPQGYGSWSLDQQVDYIIQHDLKDFAQAKALQELRNAKTPEEGAIGAADYERAENHVWGGGDRLSAQTPVQRVYDMTHPQSVVIRNHSGANVTRSLFSVAQPYAPATAQ